MNVIDAENLVKQYQRGAEVVRALDCVSLQIATGDFVAITGPSGAGKSTLLNLLGCMDLPTSGTLRVEGRRTTGLSDRDLTKLRREKIGFVFQHFGLMPALTVAENVALPALFAGKRANGVPDELLKRVDLLHRKTHRPHELSGGEAQRVAIARALVNSPRLLLADEPTGNLDSATGDQVIQLFQRLNADGLTIVVVTHNPAMAAAARVQIAMKDGRVLPAPTREGSPR